ncbi:MAG: hypothetical protein IJ574_05825 [Bacilli bacterium]|nr:hypothetical protein [Bacilli bacterium]
MLILAEFCEGGVLKVFRATGYILLIIKIIIPIVLLVMGIVDLFQAIFGTDPKALNTSIHAFIQRIIAGVIVFFVPTFLHIVLWLLSEAGTADGNKFVGENFPVCNECLYRPSGTDCNSHVDSTKDWMENVEDKIDELDKKAGD